jgi:hypothetical protein
MRYYRKTAPRVVDGKVRRKNRWHPGPGYTRTHQIQIERLKPLPGYRHFVSPTDVSAFLALLPDWPELAIGLHQVRLSNATDCQGWHAPGAVAICAWPEQRTLVLTPNYYHEHADILGRLRVPCRRLVLVPESWPNAADFPPGFETGMCCVACGRPIDARSRWYRLKGEPEVACRACGYARCDLRRDDFGPEADAEEEDGAPGYLAGFTEATVQAFQLVHVLLHEIGHHHDRMTSPRRRRSTRGERYAEAYARKHGEQIWADYCRLFKPR